MEEGAASSSPQQQQSKPFERSQSGVTSPRSSLRREKSDASVFVGGGSGSTRNAPSFLSPTASSAAKAKKLEETDHGGKKQVFHGHLK